MGRVTRRTPIHRLDAGEARARQDTLAVEEPLELRLGGSPFVVTMRTPGHDVELAAGFLAAEGVIRDRGEFLSAMHCGGPGSGGGENTYNVLDIALAHGTPAPAAKSFYTSSACGVCGKASIEEIRQASPFDLSADAASVGPGSLAEFPERLRAGQVMFDKTGGTHAAGLFDVASGEMLVVREDVGRHNAVDKVIGWALLSGRLPLVGTALQVSGRASFELVQKAMMAGIPIFGAVSAPSSLAVELAEECGITLAGFMRGEQMNVYTHPWRLGL